MIRAADALGVIRLVAAGCLPFALQAPRWRPLPVLLFAIAAVTDYVDGEVARRGRGPTRHGAVLDNVADIVFVLAGTVAGAALGLVPAAAPLAIAVAFGVYAAASLGRSTPARSRVGHAAGVLNYALVGLIAGAVAIPSGVWEPILRAGSLTIVAVNATAVLQRLVPALLGSAHASRDAGRAVRSGRSSA